MRGAFRRCEGRLRSSAGPPPAARPRGGQSGSASLVLPARVCGRGGPALSLWLASPAGGRAPQGWLEAIPGGTTSRRFEGRLVSGAFPLPAVRPLGRAARARRPCSPGAGGVGLGDPAPAPKRALLRAGVARPGGGGRASPGGVAFAVVRGISGHWLVLPRRCALGAGCRGLRPTCCGRGCAGVGARHCPFGLHAM